MSPDNPPLLPYWKYWISQVSSVANGENLGGTETFLHGFIPFMALVRVQHRWELLGNYPVFTVAMVIYHYVERIWRIIVTPVFCITYMTINIYYPGEPVNIHIQSLINIIQENNWVITTKKG